MPVSGGVSARHEMLELALDIRQQSTGPEPEQVRPQPRIAQLILDQS
jgi:hypothetical protein